MTQSIPQGFHSVNSSLTFKDSIKALEFYKKAFGAKVLTVMQAPGGKSVMHATMQIGNTILMMGDEGPQCKSAETLGGTPVTFYIYTETVDAFFNKAVQAGAVANMPVDEMFWGDRMGSLTDPFGYHWSIATKTRELTDDQIKKGAETFFASMAKK